MNCHSHSGKLNATTSPLLRLPAELRNIIYKYALGGRVLRFSRAGSKNHSIFHADTYDNPRILGLLRACRQTYSETALLPYQLNLFNFVGWRPDEFRVFLKMTSAEQIREIKCLVTYCSARDRYVRKTGVDWAKSRYLA